jgi:hypothetical protein
MSEQSPLKPQQAWQSQPQMYPPPQYQQPMPPPPLMEYSKTPSLAASRQSEMYANQKVSSRPRITIFRVVRSIVYFIAVIFAAFSLIGICNSLFGTSDRFEALAIFFGLGLLVVGVIIFLLLQRRVPQLRLAHFMWGILGTIVGLFMAFALVSALDATGKLSDFSIGYIFLLFSVILAALALW